ncbi:MAG: ATP-grasp domain-containing protein [Leptospiraceae bacterium]|nr:ATP-grasp domain-containing protein [Leptospiraceae bacterium]
MKFDQNIKTGILGGGQLGLYLLQKAMDWGVTPSIMDSSAEAPCRPFAEKTVLADFRDYNSVYQFGSELDAIAIEIDSVNAGALITLAKNGVRTYPTGDALQIIQDKGLQKSFFKEHEIPTGPFELLQSTREIKTYPGVLKSRKFGYDGHGVRMIFSVEDTAKIFEGPYLYEEKIEIEKEISVIVGKDDFGNIVVYPPSEMIFHTKKNLLDMLVFPAQIPPAVAARAQKIAKKVMHDLNTAGLLAVEFFMLKDGDLLVNEVSPRPHNSGHQTIEACDLSQYEILMRILYGLPIYQPMAQTNAVLINLLGEPGQAGPVEYLGMNEISRLPGCSIHLYGKKETRPLRKMGHITLTGDNLDELIKNARTIQDSFKVVAAEK